MVLRQGLFIGTATVLASLAGAIVSAVAQQGGSAHAGHGMAGMSSMEAMSDFDPAHVKLDFSIEAVSGDAVVAGKDARVILRLHDDRTGKPVAGRSVAGWMILRRNAQVAAEMSCAAKAKLFTQGRVTARPDVDLNAAKMMILNRDGSIGIADPQIDFTITQLQGIVPLPGVPADWTMSADGQILFVSLPVFGSVAVVDTRSFKMAGLIELGKGTLPTKLASLPDGRVAVFLSGTHAVAVVGAKAEGHGEPIEVGDGPVAMITGKAGTLYVASSDGKVTAIDTVRGTRMAAVHVIDGDPAMAWLPKAGRLYVSGNASKAIFGLDPGSLETLQTIPVSPGIFTLADEPGGRLLGLDRSASKVLLIDPVDGAVLAESPVAKSPVEIAFSHEYAYVRGLEGDHFSVIELAGLEDGHIDILNVQSAAKPVVKREALARARLVTAYGHGVLVANADEAVAYYYMEGMNTPMGTVKTYGPNVQGIMTADRSFRETEPGTYETTAVLPHGGIYDVPIVLDQAKTVTCFTVAAKEREKTPEEAVRRSLHIEAEVRSPLEARQREQIVFRIIDTQSQKPAEGLRDVRLLAFSSGGTWQTRKWAAELDGGRYAGEWSFPKPGRYGVSLSVDSKHLGFADTPPIYLDVRDVRSASPVAEGSSR